MSESITTTSQEIDIASRLGEVFYLFVEAARFSDCDRHVLKQSKSILSHPNRVFTSLYIDYVSKHRRQFICPTGDESGDDFDIAIAEAIHREGEAIQVPATRLSIEAQAAFIASLASASTKYKELIDSLQAK